MKKLGKALTFTILPFFLLSCKGAKPKRVIYDYLDHQGPVTLWGKKVEIEYSEDLNDRVDSLCAEIKSILTKENATTWWLLRKVDALYSLSYDYNLAASEADLYTAMLCTEESFNYYNEIYNSYLDASHKMNEIEKEVVKSAKYRDSYIKTYYPNLKGQALEDFINDAKTPVDPTELQFTKSMNSILSKYKSGVLSSYEFFNQYIPIANDYAEFKGFDNFIDYQYKRAYGRNYTRNDIASFENNAATRVAPLKESLQTRYLNERTEYSQEEIDKGYNLLQGFVGNNLREFENYAKTLGGEFYNNYNYLLDKGNYFFSDAMNSPFTAYCNGSATFEQYLFFGRNYQDIGTFVHEFGHYNAGYESGSYNYDILETQSQGNEMLFGYYLENYSDIPLNSTKMYVYESLDNLLDTVIRSSCVDETEQYFYTHEGMSEEEMLAKANEYCAKYGFKSDNESLDRTYFGMVSPTSTAYYISYAVSAMASISLYAYAVDEGLSKASEAYKTIYSLNGSKSFSDMVEDAGLYNPLTDEGFTSILDALDK